MSLEHILQTNVPLSTQTTLQIGGPARYLASPTSLDELQQCLDFAASKNLPVYPIGGGSNILAADEGYAGMLLRPSNKELEVVETTSNRVIIRAGAGVVWDDLVAYTVEQDLAGLECLSGIPGNVGACPIQNIGAYGQEACNIVHSLLLYDRQTGQTQRVTNEQCGFTYRMSNFKGCWAGRYIVWSVDFSLTAHGQPRLRYGDLTRHFAEYENSDLSIQDVRQAVLLIRARKSMTHSPEDPNSRSAGSFYLNPIVDAQLAAKLLEQYPDMPVYDAPSGKRKLSAAWLLDHSGCHKGLRLGQAGLSENHILALVNLGDCTAKEMLELSSFVTQKVYETFAIKLVPEPNMLGFD